MPDHAELAHLPRQPAAARRARGPQAPTRDERCLGAAAQLAAVHYTLRRGPVLQLEAGGAAAGANRTGLPDRLKSGVEALSGVALDDVRVHYNSSKPAGLQAHAYTQGSEIHVAPGQEQHLPHEAWHVVQQKQGRVKPTTQMKGVAINDDRGLESEADRLGAAAQRVGQEPARDASAAALAERRTAGSAPVQRTLYHFNKAPFTANEATSWNQLEDDCGTIGIDLADKISELETEIWNSDKTAANAIVELKKEMRTKIVADKRDKAKADEQTWDTMTKYVKSFAGSYGTVTGPKSTHGHASDTYTFTGATKGAVHYVAVETDAHGKTEGNLNTRKGELKKLVESYNDEVQAKADVYK